MNTVRSIMVAAALAAAALLPVQAQSAGADPLRALLQESKEKNRGVTLNVAGSSLSLIVVEVGDTWLVGRSNASSRIVVRMDRIDAATAGF